MHIIRFITLFLSTTFPPPPAKKFLIRTLLSC